MGASSRILQPVLERHAARTILIDGLDMSARTDESGVIPDGKGHETHQTVWTGRVDGGMPFTGPGGLSGELPDGPSIDQVVADRIASDAALHSVQMGLWPSPYADVRKTQCYTGSGQPLNHEHDAAILYERFFTPLDRGDPSGAASRRRLSLDTLRGELTRLRGELPRDDRERLDRHLEGWNAFEGRLDAAARTCEVGELPSAEGLEARAEAHRWLIARAFACDRTPVIAYNLTPEVDWIAPSDVPTLLPGWSGTGEIHLASHLSARDASATEDLTLLKEWEAAWFAALLDLLHETPSVEGSLLDETIVVWATSMSHGGHHIVRNTPCVIAHGDGGPWATGRYLRAPDAGTSTLDAWSSGTEVLLRGLGTGFPNNQLLVSIANAFGIDVDVFGDERFVGPLEALT